MSRSPSGRRGSFFARRRNEALQKGKLRAYVPSPSSPATSSAAGGGGGDKAQQPQQPQPQRGRRPSFYARRQSRAESPRVYERDVQQRQQQPHHHHHHHHHHLQQQQPQGASPQAHNNPNTRNLPMVAYTQPPVPTLPDSSTMSLEDLQMVALQQAEAIRVLQQQQSPHHLPTQGQRTQSPHRPSPQRRGGGGGGGSSGGGGAAAPRPGAGARPGVPSTEGVTEDTLDELAALDRAIQEVQARQIGSHGNKTKEDVAREDRDEQVADCCYDCCCFSLV